MIRYTLKCEDGHRFDSWFSSSADFDRLDRSGHLACAICGSAAVSKALMAPGVASGSTAPTPATVDGNAAVSDTPLSAPAHPAEQALRALRRKIEATAEDVGRDFAAEARRIHEGDAPKRPIYGEARAADARKLVEDGVPVAPLPWRARTDS